MLSVFPELLTYSLLAPLIIRLALGALALLGGLALVRGSIEKAPTTQERALGALLLLGSALVLLGLWTQIGAIILGAVFFYQASTEKKSRVRSLLALAMAASLLFSGAGFLAFDLPL